MDDMNLDMGLNMGLDDLDDAELLMSFVCDACPVSDKCDGLLTAPYCMMRRF